VLVPTRELAMQVAEAVHKYAKGVGRTVLALYGGAVALVVEHPPAAIVQHFRGASRRADDGRRRRSPLAVLLGSLGGHLLVQETLERLYQVI
jgi:hypothetical protein